MRSDPAEPVTTITVLLHAHLRHHDGGQERLVLPHRPWVTVADYIEGLGIPGHELTGIVLDGELSVALDRVPAAGALLELVPAVTGGQGSHGSTTRPDRGRLKALCLRRVVFFFL